MVEYLKREDVLAKAAPVPGCFSHMISAYDVACLPAEEVEPKKSYRVPSKEEWIRQYGTNKQIAGFEKRQSKV